MCVCMSIQMRGCVYLLVNCRNTCSVQVTARHQCVGPSGVHVAAVTECPCPLQVNTQTESLTDAYICHGMMVVLFCVAGCES